MVANVMEPFKQALSSFPATSDGSGSNSDSSSGVVLSSSVGGGSGNGGNSNAAHSIATLLTGLGDMGLIPQLRVRSSDGKNAASSSSDPLAGAGAKSSSDGKDPTSSSDPLAGAGTTSPSAPNGDGSGAGTASSGSAAVSSMTQSGAQLAANGRSGWASSAVAADPAGGGGGSRSTIRLRAEGTSAPGGRRRLHASSAQQQQQQQQEKGAGSSSSASSAQVSSVLSQLLSTVMPQLLGSGSHGGGLGGLVIPPMSFSVTSGTTQLAEQGGPTAAARLQQQGDPTAAAGQQPQGDHGFIGSSARPANTNLFAIAPGSKALEGAAIRGGLLAGRLGAALGGIGGGGGGGAQPTVTSFSVTGGTTAVTPVDKVSQPGDGSSSSGSTTQQQEAVHPANANTNPITLPGNAAAGGGGWFGALLREALLGQGSCSSAGGLGSRLGGLSGACCRCSS